MQDFSQTINADGTTLDMKGEGHGLYALMGCFCHVRSTGLRAYWCGCVHYLGGISMVTLQLEGGMRGSFICTCN